MMWWSVRGVVAAWLVGCASTEEDMTLAEAECVLRGTNLTFLGDSQSRFCVYGLNAFLATGALRSEEFSDAHDGNLGAGPGSDDYDATFIGKLLRQRRILGGEEGKEVLG